MFKDQTYQELKSYSATDRIIAVVRCEKVRVTGHGTRSERHTMTATVVNGPAAMPPGTKLLLSRYAQGPVMEIVGKTYLIAGYMESPSDPWALVELRPVQPENSDSDWKAVQVEALTYLEP